MYSIKDWDETFETSQSKRCTRRMNWVACPTGCDSIGYVRLMGMGEAGATAFGVFNAVIQWSASRPIGDRGKIHIPLADLSCMVRIPEKTLSKSFKLLMTIGWIIENHKESSGITINHTESQTITENQQESQPLTINHPTRQDITLHNKTEQNTTRQDDLFDGF